jgi:polyisoprenoid-binding protein YceI
MATVPSPHSEDRIVQGRRRWIILGSLTAATVVAGVAVWWVFLRSDAPEAVTLEGAVESATSTTADGGAASPPADATGLEGAWTLADDGRSFAGYRVEEELARIGLFTAVGRSTVLEGSLEIRGDAVTSVEVIVDMTALESDDSRRDNAIRTQALETNSFPQASFRTTASIPLPADAGSGTPLAFQATGELTLHGVTRAVTVPLEAQLVDDTVVVVGSLDVRFADYDIEQPRAAIVLSVDDEGIMEFQLVFERA